MKPPPSSSPPRVLRRDDSLRSRDYRGISIRVLYECDGLEVVRIDMDPATALDEREITEVCGLHFVIGGSPVFHVSSQSSDLMPGDSIALTKGQHCRISNPMSARSSILSFVFKNASFCPPPSPAGRRIAKLPDTEKEISR